MCNFCALLHKQIVASPVAIHSRNATSFTSHFVCQEEARSCNAISCLEGQSICRKRKNNSNGNSAVTKAVFELLFDLFQTESSQVPANQQGNHATETKSSNLDYLVLV